jgi:hypothetical protein
LFKWNYLAFALLVAASLPYFISVIPSVYYPVYQGFLFVVFSLIAVIVVGKASKKLNSMRMLYYALILMVAASFLALINNILALPESSILIILSDAVQLAGYLLFIASVYFLFQDVYIQITREKVIAALLVITATAVLFYLNFQSMINVNTSFYLKFYALSLPVIDTALLVFVIIVLLFVHSEKFLKVYGWVLLAIIANLAADFSMVGVNASMTLSLWSASDILEFLAYFLVIQFAQQWNELLYGGFQKILEASRTLLLNGDGSPRCFKLNRHLSLPIFLKTAKQIKKQGS